MLKSYRYIRRFEYKRYFTEVRKKIIVLGSGWGGFRFVKDIDKDYCDVTVVSPRNHFIFTPLLPSTTVGTLEFRAIIEPIRLVNNSYYQAYCKDIIPNENKIVCEDKWTDKEFQLHYDYLVIGVGSRPNTFNTPGVEKNCFFLREISDSRKIRQRIIACLEEASNNFCNEELKQRLLTFAVIGGGPTSVEFSAELHDFIKYDVTRSYPTIALDSIKIILIEAADHILGTFDSSLSKFTEKHFKRQKIEVLTNTKVKEVLNDRLVLIDGKEIPFGLCVWSTGNTMNPLVKSLNWKKEERSGRLLVDNRLRIIGYENIFALGDCAVAKSNPLPQTAQSAQQEGKYLVWLFNNLKKGKTIDEINPFRFENKGMLAYIGEYNALANFKSHGYKGFLTFIFWRSAYFTKLVSIKNKILVPMYWFKTLLFGRDISSF